jgi:predicted RNase H-like HicB family nuclease
LGGSTGGETDAIRAGETYCLRICDHRDMVVQERAKERLRLIIVYEPDEEWVMASIPAVPGVLSQGRTREEARENVLDALALMLSPDPVEAGDQRERELLRLTVDGALSDTPSPRADLSGHYVLVGELEEERVVLAPNQTGPISLTDTRISAMHERLGTRELTPEELEEFWREYGPHMLPPDGEG